MTFVENSGDFGGEQTSLRARQKEAILLFLYFLR